MRDTTVLDYWPTCSCPAAPPVPAVVLDPFCGTATTMLAARTLGRQSIGIDLSGDYLAISVKRLGDPRKAQMEMTV
ncbi:MAG: DNA methyltransferase [Dehalococcoidia bacterium]|nr:DNA methyltransferase [Dehalococcoidia bacterium]